MQLHPTLLGVAAAAALSWPCTAVGAPRISELVAVGNNSLADEDGNTPDWLEIHNPAAAAVELGGYHLTDDPLVPAKWTFPATTLAAGDFLVVFASDKNRAAAGSQLHTNFKLAGSGEYLALVAPDGSTVVSEFSPAFPAQVATYSYGIGAGDVAGYFAQPTPGAANGTVLAAPLLAPAVTPPGATFTASVAVTLTTTVPGGVIRYTTDGSAPDAGSDQYVSALTFNATTHLRAAVFDPASGSGGAVAGAQFIKLGTAASGGLGAPSGFTSDLPIMVVENFGAGSVPDPGSVLQTARVAVHEVDPATGRSSLAAGPDASFRMGIRKRGQSSSGFAKPQYRVELRDELDEDLDHPLLGLPAESDWVFNGPWTDKALIRNPLAFELGRTIGIDAPRTAHFEMFLNTDGGDLSAAEYVGVYVLVEKIKVGGNRTDIETLDPGDGAEPEVSGGYLLRFEPPGIAGQGSRATGWTSVEVVDPPSPSAAQRDWIGGYLNGFAATLGWSHGSGANNSGAVDSDPATGYPAYIDVDSFVHLLLVNELLRDQDAYVRSDYMYKDRGGKLHKGPLWDYNLTAGTGCCFDNRNTAGWQYADFYNRGGRDHFYEPDWFVPLLRDPDFRQRYIDRWSELRDGGILELGNLLALIDRLADPLAESAVRNFTKWDNLSIDGPGFPSPQTSTWEEQVDFMKTWLTTRMGWIDSQFLPAPLLAPAGGEVPGGSEVTAGSAETVYYTVDGSDPRLPGGGIRPGALALPPSQGNVTVTYFGRGSGGWRYLDDGSDLGASDIVEGHAGYGSGNWKHPGFDDSAWASGAGVLGFGSVGDATITTPLARGPLFDQYRTYYFRRTFDVASASQVLSLSCDLLRDDGAIIYINGREVARHNMVAGAIPASGFSATSVNGPSESVYHTITLDPAALVDGVNVIAVELHQDTGGSSDVGFDLSLSGVAPAGGSSFAVGATTLVTARARDASGEWSAPVRSVYVVGTAASAAEIAPTELNYHPGDPTPSEQLADPTYRDDDFEFLELKNTSGGPVDLSGARFVDGIDFVFPTPTVLGPGGYLLVVENAEAFAERYGPGLPVAGVYGDKQSNDGEALRLVALDGTDIFHFTFNDIWYPSTDGLGRSLVAADESALPSDYNAPGSWKASAAPGGSPGRADGVTFASWLAENFTPAEIADPAVTGPGVDLNGNGFGTLLSYALGLDPRAPQPGRYPEVGIVTAGGEYVSLTFRRRKGAGDLTYGVWVSGNLLDWAPTAEVVGAIVDNGDGTETVTVRDTVPLGGAGGRFVRLSVEQN